MTTYRLVVTSSADDLARRVAETIASRLDLALAERDRALIALAGGETPRAAYTLLGQEHLPWERVDVLLGDERMVPPDAAASNARMLRETLLESGPGHGARFHPVPTEVGSAEACAEAYTALLAQLSPGAIPIFDVVLLGLGDDGHTASLFPGTAACLERVKPVTIGEGKGLPRLSLSAPVLSAARQVIFLVSGVTKAEALRRLLDPQESVERTPARLVSPATEVLILADAAAAGTATA
ncbi:6-phosphogluconolactonase [Synechococcus sp. CCY9202]|uniref:6-phosphogluconolactonase n=1 Tax=Synechococcus sp. CCY9202 TaxID=174698 RepID=UPI002B217A85|nr:6-phosphogluconolactonase [Synechococcus sp. CCY9202]MEA5422956.1 6-phosphogluconolactonase [Synechococcus sp. CCY9202]